jgi:hypothetical protein
MTHEAAEQGVCALCGQELIRTDDDCWHPHTVARPCPPEHFIDGMWRPEFGHFSRPGREHFRPVDQVLIDGPALAAELGIAPGTIRNWATAGLIERRGRDSAGRTIYDLDQVTKIAQRRARREDGVGNSRPDVIR